MAKTASEDVQIMNSLASFSELSVGYSFETNAIHGGYEPSDANFNSVSPPIMTTSTYKMADIGIPDLTNGTYIYSRFVSI